MTAATRSPEQQAAIDPLVRQATGLGITIADLID